MAPLRRRRGLRAAVAAFALVPPTGGRAVGGSWSNGGPCGGRADGGPWPNGGPLGGRAQLTAWSAPRARYRRLDSAFAGVGGFAGATARQTRGALLTSRRHHGLAVPAPVASQEQPPGQPRGALPASRLRLGPASPAPVSSQEIPRGQAARAPAGQRSRKHENAGRAGGSQGRGAHRRGHREVVSRPFFTLVLVRLRASVASKAFRHGQL